MGDHHSSQCFHRGSRSRSSLFAKVSLIINAALLLGGLYVISGKSTENLSLPARTQIHGQVGVSPALVSSRCSRTSFRDLSANARKRTVDVLLKESIEGTGKKGEITAVKPGFWRNYLLPQGLATQPTAEYLEELRLEEERKLADAKAKKDAAIKLRDGLQLLSFTIRMKAQEDGTLYGGVRPADIVEAVKSQTGTELDPKTVELPSNMDKLDTYTVFVNLHPEVKASFPVSIQKGK